MIMCRGGWRLLGSLENIEVDGEIEITTGGSFNSSEMIFTGVIHAKIAGSAKVDHPPLQVLAAVLKSCKYTDSSAPPGLPRRLFGIYSNS